jgi:mycothiol synthase
LRTFQVGHDDEAWLTANAAAFVAHPEQGRLTEVDLQERLAQAWFDARGFFLVCAPDGSVAAFCWTKVPLSAEATAGEIYAIGVTPENQRRGLAGFLLEIAFAHLTAFGLTEVTLFVEESNLAARAVYSEVGFQEVTRDVQYEKAS